jgi:hypothetical protein
MEYRTVKFRYAVDQDGAKIVRLELKNGKQVKMDAASFLWLREAGYSLRWTNTTDRRGNEYVMIPVTKASGNLLTAARVIMGAERGQQVSYRDGDRLNLRTDNLAVSPGYSKRTDVSIVPSYGRPPPIMPLSLAAA